MFAAAVSGFKLTIGLIMAIGAQNAFVLRQGLRREHVLLCVLFCAASDAILIAAGIVGLSAANAAFPWLGDALRWGGVAFLTVYALRALWSAWRGQQALTPASGAAPSSAWRVIAILAAITWLNPHVYLDTVVLIGSVASQFPGRELAFGIGAACGSLIFFLSLGFGARLLGPIFARPAAWRVLDLAVAGIMGAIAFDLAMA
ncbi:L-lysine exporter family protein LysE/ArgO [Albidovulum inexpectatum]|uniref:L-lysine exporter family protein LysE/ArgO n=1 Tax=Albidovulum inexpectatum TaxID=196587 RepID=A0A2S5JFQ5_9RHOB|nr:LysE/ArgO family amino acid transporter [Albidovulum inexpectatum]PPB80260.1 L-lysine exporter family protein LysE/ArgO [Albidovulum inexpectatum]